VFPRYDSSLAVELLEWRPQFTFDRMVAALAGRPAEAAGIDPEDAKVGRY